MKFFTIKFSLAIFCIAGLAAGDPPKWAHDASDLAPDPAVTWGVLSNGVRYAILPNAEPPGRVSLRLLVQAGSLMENENQRGLAHFLEHMAFNGTKNFPAGEMVEYFQRLGMAFGADTNAHTSFHETVYKLELPKNETAMLATGLQLLRDYAGRIELSPEEIEKERGVILSEKLSGNTPEYRSWLVGMAHALPESILPNRIPIGIEEVIKTADRELFLDFYESYYVPHRMAVVATGDVSSSDLTTMIEAAFGDFQAAREPGPDPDLGRVSTGRGVVAKLHHEPEASGVNVSIEALWPGTGAADNAKSRKSQLLVDLAHSIINLRLEEAAKQKDSPFLSGQAYHNELLGFVKFTGAAFSCVPEKWEATLEAGEQAIRQALEHGFTEGEFDQVVANYRNAFLQAAERAETRKSRDLADSLVSSISENEVFDHPESALKWFESTMQGVTRADFHEALKSAWGASDDRLILVSGNLNFENAEEKILSVFRASQEKVVDPTEEKVTSDFAYTDFGAAGKVVDRKEVEDLEVTQLQFANNVRVNFKKTSFQKNTIRLLARVGNGALDVPCDKPGIAIFANSAFALGGLEAHSNDELERILAGRTVGTTFAVSEDAFLFGGRTNREDLLLQLQLMCAEITAPGYREEAQVEFRKNIETLYQSIKHDPMGVYQAQIDPLLKGNDPRFSFPTRQELEERNLNEVREWLTDPLRRGYLELSIVGDFEEEALIEALSQTFGALTEREKEKSITPAMRRLQFPTSIREVNYRYDSETPRSLAIMAWPTTDMDNIRRARRLSVLATIFADRLRVKVREELGETYSPYARNVSSDVFADYGYLFSFVEIATDQAESVLSAIRVCAQGLREDGLTEDELARATAPLITSIDQQLRDNSYWLQTVLSKSQEEPRRLEWAREIKQDYQSVALKEVQDLAREFLIEPKAITITVSPEAGKSEKDALLN